jgi:osmotically-inducible protein OsmY
MTAADLPGAANRLLGGSRVAAAARSVEGNRPRKEQSMKKTLMNDTTLADAVRTELQWDPKVDPAHIGVSAVDGAVTLTGYVASFPQEHAAVHAAERVHGVRAVADELDVTRSQSAEPPSGLRSPHPASCGSRTIWS